MAKWSPKDPSDIADYWFDWSAFLGEGEDIDTAAVTAADGLTITAWDHTNKTVRVRLSGGTAGTGYEITCLITTDTGETFEITKTLQVKERAVT